VGDRFELGEAVLWKGSSTVTATSAVFSSSAKYEPVAMMRSSSPVTRKTIRVKTRFGSASSHICAIADSPGLVSEKNRLRRDSGESRLKKAISASVSAGWATRMVAVVPSRRIRRPCSAES
jgi:hypothetical protein